MVGELEFGDFFQKNLSTLCEMIRLTWYAKKQAWETQGDMALRTSKQQKKYILKGPGNYVQHSELLGFQTLSIVRYFRN
jgi:hypothetical protein